MILKISAINSLLIKRFGIPKRNRKDTNPLDMLIATILSQNTNDKNSYQAYNSLKSRFSKWDKIVDAKLTVIENSIRVGGLAKQKARTIKSILKQLQLQKKMNLNFLNDLTVDDAISELTRFKGVGVKTASCVLLFSLGRNVCPVDTHVHRTLNRIGVVKTNAPAKTYEVINKNLPEGIAHALHTNLIKLGRDICKSTKPVCSICPLLKVCGYKNKNLTPPKNMKSNHFLLLDNV